MRRNISSVRTKQMMADALEELAQTKSIDKITILDITNKCDINRQTFYYHFHDIYELAEFMFKSYTENVLGKEIDPDNWDEAVLNAATFMLQKKNLLVGFAGTVGHYYITNFVIDYIRPYIKNLIIKTSGDKSVDDYYFDFLSNYYTVTFSGILIEWLVTGMYETMSPEELVRLIRITSEGNVGAALDRYAQSK